MDDILARIAQQRHIFVKSEQRGDPPLEIDQKIDILRDLLCKNPIKFIERYHEILESNDIKNLPQLAQLKDTCSKVYIEMIDKKSTQMKSPKDKMSLVKNRRYESLRRLVKEGKYFSDWQMKIRDPLLFENMVGKYMTLNQGTQMYETAESLGLTDNRDNKFSGMLMDLLSNDKNLQNRTKMEAVEQCEGMTLDEGSESEDSEMDDHQLDTDNKGKTPIYIPNEEKLLLHNELVGIMQERFLGGEDTEFFDYSEVDFNPDYDPIQLISRDIQDNYFDSQEPS